MKKLKEKVPRKLKNQSTVKQLQQKLKQIDFPMTIYQILTERQLKKFLKNLGYDLYELTPVELKKPDFGDYIVCPGYKFKKVYSNYQCMETPSEKHEVKQLAYFKAENDKPKNFYK